MSKRFTDTEKWDDEWFLSLDNDSRVVWQFLLDRCSIAGCWKKNFTMLNFCCKVLWDDKKLQEVFDGRVINRGGFYFIPKFVKFQNPRGLNSDKPVVVSIRKELVEKNLMGIIIQSFGNDYGMIKGKGKGKGKGKDKILSFKEYKNNIEYKYRNGEITLEKKDELLRTYK